MLRSEWLIHNGTQVAADLWIKFHHNIFYKVGLVTICLTPHAHRNSAMLKSLSILLLLPGLLSVAAKTITELDLFTDVVYEPAEAWNHVNLSEADGSNCNGLMSHYTKTLNANMTFQFEGV